MKLRKAFVVFGLSLMTALSVSVAADTIEPNSVATIDVVFDSNTGFTVEEQQIIRDHFIGCDDMIQLQGVKCTLFGHDYKTEIVTVITHKARSSAPRCLKENFETKVCTVCSDTVSTPIGSKSFIYCCN